MTAVTTATGARAGATPGNASASHPTRFADVLVSEWTKLRSVRSTYWTLAVAAVLGVGVGALISKVSANHYASDPTLRLNWSPTNRSLLSLGIAQLAFAVFGVMVITGEYATGMIRTSLAAVPKRSHMLAAKALISTSAALVLGEIISFAAFLIGQALISGKAPTASLGQPGVLRAVIGSGLYLAAISLLGLAFGTLFRNAAAGIAMVVAMLFVLPGIIAGLPQSWSQPIEKWWPTNAGSQVSSVGHPIRDFGANVTLGPWAGFGVMCAFLAVLLVIGFYLLERRDA